VRHPLWAILILGFGGTLVRADDGKELVAQARTALSAGRVAEAAELASKAIAGDPNNGQAYFIRGVCHEVREKHAEAIADFDKVITLDPKHAEAYNRRGSEQFKLGKISESLADFDKFLALRPDEFPGHWKRGISLYYAGKFDDGRKQFEGYEKVDTNDVENAVWHFLCVARGSSVEKARAGILKIGNDRRVPMMQVYALYAGKLEPGDVLAAVREGKPQGEQLNNRLFYAHLYLGLYHEVNGDKKQALEHLRKAAEEHKIGHYMWDVANVHYQMLRK
jgi:lipoprotein NlpI